MHATVAPAQALAADLAAFLVHLHRTSLGGWFRTVAELELSLTQLKTLHVLSAQGEPSVKEIAESLSLSLPAASRAVEGLVGRGLVERRECAEDRRSRLVRLSPTGKETIERVLAARLEDLDAFVATLSEAERTQLHAALNPLVARLAT